MGGGGRHQGLADIQPLARYRRRSTDTLCPTRAEGSYHQVRPSDATTRRMQKSVSSGCDRRPVLPNSLTWKALRGLCADAAASADLAAGCRPARPAAPGGCCGGIRPGTGGRDHEVLQM